MVPLVVADLTRGTGRFNLGQGILGTATGIWRLADRDARRLRDRPFRQRACLRHTRRDRRSRLTLVALMMPETRPEKE